MSDLSKKSWGQILSELHKQDAMRQGIDLEERAKRRLENSLKYNPYLIWKSQQEEKQKMKVEHSGFYKRGDSMNEIVINGVTYVKKQPVGPLSIVRTDSAGVHIGEVVSLEGKKCVLKNARRLWRWRGANTLNEVALTGVLMTEYTRISQIIPHEITLTEAIEVIPVADGVRLEPVWND
jgi:hypothetical protein